MKKQFICRMRYNTFLRIKAVFKAYSGESVASYFNRLAVKLEMQKPRDIIMIDTDDANEIKRFTKEWKARIKL